MTVDNSKGEKSKSKAPKNIIRETKETYLADPIENIQFLDNTSYGVPIEDQHQVSRHI